jgi:hypothetical protein
MRERAREDIARRQAAEEQIKEDDRHAKAVEQAGKEAATQEEKMRDAAAKGEAAAQKIADEYDAKKLEETKKAQEDEEKAQNKSNEKLKTSLIGGTSGGTLLGMSSRDVAAQSEYGRQVNKMSDLATSRAIKEENARETQRSLDATKEQIRRERDAADKFQSHKDDQISNTEALNKQRSDREAAEKKSREEQGKGGRPAKDATGEGKKKADDQGAEGQPSELSKIHELLQKNLEEMRTYAYVA